MAETQLVLRSDSQQAIVRIAFNSLSAIGVAYPVFTVTLEARVIQPQGAVLAPESVRAVCKVKTEVIAFGEATLPLNTWHPNHEQRFNLQFHLTDRAVKLIEDSLFSDYLSMELRLTGLGQWSEPQGQTHRGQFSETSMEVELSRIDWMNKVLKPIGWADYFFVSYRVPRQLDSKEAQQSAARLRELNERYALGDDRGVFPLSYDAIDQFYSRREEILDRVSDESKRATVKELLEVVHRFANGGRHRPEERRARGGFEVNRNDAELMRGLATHLSAYLAKL